MFVDNEGMIGLQDYGDARANHRHDPHHPLTVKGKPNHTLIIHTNIPN